VAHQSQKSTTKLLRLPNEILVMVFSWVDDLADAVSLCLVDGRFFELGHKTIVRLQKRASGSWAGDRIICLGDNCQENELPENIQEIINKDREELCPQENTEYESVYELISQHYLRTDGGQDFYGPLDFSRLLEDYVPFLKLLTAKRDRVLRNPSVLCNLTKKVYVRTQALDALDLEGRIGLKQALLSRVCWSSDDSLSMCTSVKIHQGAWAGDRFEVMAMSRFAARSDPEWKDVSEEVANEIEKIWNEDMLPFGYPLVKKSKSEQGVE
jgi:hypothetical protein